jgi:hypothetical protein
MAPKKRQPGRPAPPKDFEKKTVRVGKIKKGPANVTDTSFTSKRVAIREQSIVSKAKHEDGAERVPVLDRLKPWLQGCGNYSASTRKESLSTLTGRLADLQSEAELVSLLDPILTATFRCICDEDPDVRCKTALFLGDLFGRVDADAVRPFYGRWMSFVKLALSHLNPGIRNDALKHVHLALKTLSMSTIMVPDLPGLILQVLPQVKAFGGNNGSSKKKLSSAAFAVDPFGLTIEVLKLWIQAQEAMTWNDAQSRSRPLLCYTWQPVQQRMLTLVRPKAALGGDSLVPEQCVRDIVSQVSLLTVASWLDCGPSASGASVLIPGQTKTKPQDEAQKGSLSELLAVYRTLYRFVQLATAAETPELFWTALPSKISRNRDLIEPHLRKTT